MTFSVMVIGERPEAQLAPYRCLPVGLFDEHCEFIDTEDKCREEYEKGRAAGAVLPDGRGFHEAYHSFEAFMADAAGYPARDPEMDRYGYWEMPPDYWDQCILGGKWCGLMVLKPGRTGILGHSGMGDGVTGISSAKKGDIANLNELSAAVIVIDGQWIELGSDDAKPGQAKATIDGYLAGLPDEITIGIYHCHW